MKSEISMPGLVRQLTLEVVVTGIRLTKMRIWLGTRIIKLGALVVGCGVEIRDGE